MRAWRVFKFGLNWSKDESKEISSIVSRLLEVLVFDVISDFLFVVLKLFVVESECLGDLLLELCVVLSVLTEVVLDI